MLPLAQVRAGRLGEPADDACRTWGKRGQTWLALDALGRVMGEATVKELERSFEIVVHHQENEGEWYGDGTLTRSKRGWMTISAGIFGSTA